MMYRMICAGCGYRKRMRQEQLCLGVRCPRCERFMDVDTRYGQEPSRVDALLAWCRFDAHDAECLRHVLKWQGTVFIVMTVGLLPAYGLFLFWRYLHPIEPPYRRPRRPYRFGWLAGVGEWLVIGLAWALPSVGLGLVVAARSGNFFWLVFSFSGWLIPALVVGLGLRKIIGPLANAVGAFCVILNLGMTGLICGWIIRPWAMFGRPALSPGQFGTAALAIFLAACCGAGYGALVGLLKRATTRRPEPTGGAGMRAIGIRV